MIMIADEDGNNIELIFFICKFYEHLYKVILQSHTTYTQWHPSRSVMLTWPR
jgi:hypothetical protein